MRVAEVLDHVGRHTYVELFCARAPEPRWRVLQVGLVSLICHDGLADGRSAKIKVRPAPDRKVFQAFVGELALPPANLYDAYIWQGIVLKKMFKIAVGEALLVWPLGFRLIAEFQVFGIRHGVVCGAPLVENIRIVDIYFHFFLNKATPPRQMAGVNLFTATTRRSRRCR